MIYRLIYIILLYHVYCIVLYLSPPNRVATMAIPIDDLLLVPTTHHRVLLLLLLLVLITNIQYSILYILFCIIILYYVYCIVLYNLSPPNQIATMAIPMVPSLYQPPTIASYFFFFLLLIYIYIYMYIYYSSILCVLYCNVFVPTKPNCDNGNTLPMISSWYQPPIIASYFFFLFFLLFINLQVYSVN